MITVSSVSAALLSNQALTQPNRVSQRPARLHRSVNGQFVNFRGEQEYASYQTDLSGRSERVLRSYLHRIDDTQSAALLAERYPIAPDGMREPIDDIIKQFVHHKASLGLVVDQINKIGALSNTVRKEASTLLSILQSDQFQRQSEAHQRLSNLYQDEAVPYVLRFLGADVYPS